MMFRTKSDAAVASLEARVEGVERGMTELRDAISLLSAKIDATSKTPWVTIWSAAAVVVALLSFLIVLVYKPIEVSQASLSERLGGIEEDDRRRSDRNAASIERLREDYVSQRQHNTLVNEVRREIQSYFDSLSQRVTYNANAIEGLRSGIVSRAEHDEKWRSEADRSRELTRQIEELRAQLRSIATPQDVIGTLRERLTELEKFVREAAFRASPTK